ncbi:MAG TPA: alpha/beta hydrolase [Gaiellaceae bacterium]|nr:alpha/beta hydrolase [Gaiellaceae bacterium]
MRVEVEGARLFVDVDGSKLRPDGRELVERPTVLIVHTGPGNDHSPYRDHIGPFLAAEMQVVYLDLRGFGRSDLSEPARWNTEQWSSDIHAITQVLGIDRPVVLGAGWGAYTALRYAQRWPDELGKLVLVNPAARIVVPRIVARFDELGGPSAGEAAFMYYEHPSEQSIARYMRECFHVTVGPENAEALLLNQTWTWTVAVHWMQHEARTLDLRPALGDISAPTLIAAGTDDPQYPRASIAEVVEGIPHATVRWYEGARHSIFRDRPEVNQMIRGWILA